MNVPSRAGGEMMIRNKREKVWNHKSTNKEMNKERRVLACQRTNDMPEGEVRGNRSSGSLRRSLSWFRSPIGEIERCGRNSRAGPSNTSCLLEMFKGKN